MDSDGNITNLSAQSLNDLNDTTLSTLEDGHILIYDQNSDKWVNQDFHEVGINLKIPSLYDENGDVKVEAKEDSVDVFARLNMNGEKITDLSDPVDDTDAVNLKTLTQKIDEIPIGGGGGGSSDKLVNDSGKTVAQATSAGIDLIATNDITMLKTDVGGVEVFEHLRLKASQYGNAMEIGEGDTKFVYFKFDQLKNPNFIANYNKGFIFRVDETIDNLLTDDFSPFSIFKDNVISNAPHTFTNGAKVKGV